MKHGNGEHASFYAFVKKFSKCDSISAIPRVGVNGPMLSLIPSASLPFALTLTVVGFDNL
jgi:hypothetical protein